MSTASNLALAVILGFFALVFGLQVLVRWRAARLRGQPLPALPGPTGQRIAASERALVYFFTPNCAACRPVTPRMQALAQAGKPVFPVDASRDLALAQALSVMATPTTVEVDHGTVVGVHVGPPAPEVWARFA
jgi:thioredoxin 1